MMITAVAVGAVLLIVAQTGVHGVATPKCCKPFSFSTNNMLQSTEDTAKLAEENNQQLRYVNALLDELRGLRERQLGAFEAWKKLCTEQALGQTGSNGDPGERGDKGYEGDRGKWGDTGFPGADGKPGVHGAYGIEGHPGAIGPVGETGRDGQPGRLLKQNGPPGEIGGVGSPGYEQGEPGLPGFRGRRGEYGNDGHYGYVGPESVCCPREEKYDNYPHHRIGGPQPDHRQDREGPPPRPDDRRPEHGGERRPPFRPPPPDGDDHHRLPPPRERPIPPPRSQRDMHEEEENDYPRRAAEQREGEGFYEEEDDDERDRAAHSRPRPHMSDRLRPPPRGAQRPPYEDDDGLKENNEGYPRSANLVHAEDETEADDRTKAQSRIGASEDRHPRPHHDSD